MNNTVSEFSIRKVNNVALLEDLYSDKIKKILNSDSFSKTVKLKSGEVRIFRDCYEYYINGRSLSNIIANKNGIRYPQNHPCNKLRFLEFSAGIIGSFNSFTSRIAIESLLLNTYSKSQIAEMDVFKKYTVAFGSEQKRVLLDETFDALDNEVKWVYTSVDGDPYCDGWSFKITKNDDFYIWNDLNPKNELVFKFEKKPYENMLNDYYCK